MFPRTLVIVLFLAAQTALLWFVAARDRAPEARFAWTTNTVPMPLPPPAIAPAPAPAPVPVAPPATSPPATSRPSCPPMRTDAAPLPKDHALPRGVNHVTTSWTNSGWLAAWSEQTVHVSFDGGLTFAQVLDGPGTVEDVTFDCFGRAIVLRAGNRVGIRDQGHEMWRSVPGMRTDEDAPSALIGGGPDVLVVGVDGSETWHARVAVSADVGATWWYRDLVDYWESSTVTGHQDADGTIDMAITTADCMSDPTTWIRISTDGKIERDELGDVGGIRLYEGFAISHRDGLSWKRFGAPENAWTDLGDAENPDSVGPFRGAFVDGPLPRVIDENGRIAVVGRDMVAKPLRPWKYGTDASVDRAGRLWAIDETRDGEDAWLVAVPGTKAPIPPPEPMPSNE